jgi:glycosyltransferase involved in cell wall biosynthesis
MVELARAPTNETARVTKLTVVAAIPCYNTAKNIAQVVAATKKYVDEVIVIDDGSQDKTAAVARKAGARVIRHEKNRGKGAAMKTAIENIESDIIVFIDGDGQHNPHEIPGLLSPILNQEADLVFGSRFLHSSVILERSQGSQGGADTSNVELQTSNVQCQNLSPDIRLTWHSDDSPSLESRRWTID